MADLKKPTYKSRNNTKSLERPFIFIHLPKTGGTTLSIIARRNEKPWSFKQFWNFIKRTDVPTLAQYRTGTIYGHFGYGAHLLFKNKTKATYITFMRDPIDRVISHYYYHKTERNDPNYEFASKHTLEEWVQLSKHAINKQTQLISGLVTHPANNYSLEIAIQHLNNFGFIGLTEKFDESLFLMKYYLGWDLLTYVTRKQTRMKPKTSEIPKNTIELIKKANWMDIILYDLAKKKFQNQIDNLHIENIDQKLEVFRKQNPKQSESQSIPASRTRFAPNNITTSFKSTIHLSPPRPTGSTKHT